MDAFDAGINIIFFILIIYLISRVAIFMKHTRDKLDEMDKKIDVIREYIDNKD
jgi:uncharacterized membrane protein